MEHIPAHFHYGRPQTTAGMQEAIGHPMTVSGREDAAALTPMNRLHVVQSIISPWRLIIWCI